MALEVLNFHVLYNEFEITARRAITKDFVLLKSTWLHRLSSITLNISSSLHVWQAQPTTAKPETSAARRSGVDH